MVDDSQRRITLRDVAWEAGVSHMTVSRVARGLKNVDAATEKRVRAVIKQLGYQPDPAMSALAHYRTAGGGRGDGSTMAFIDCDRKEFSLRVLGGAREEAQRLGYRIEHHALPESLKGQQQLNRHLFHRGVRGLLFGPSDAERKFAGWSWDEYAAVSLGAHSHEPPMHAVAQDYFYSAYSGYQKLQVEGAQRIGFAVDAVLEHRTGHRMCGGYLAAARSANSYCYEGDINNVQAFQDWKRRCRLDGLLTIHRGLVKVWRDARRLLFINSQPDAEQRGYWRLELDPLRIGQEGVRLLHHSLLRREYGLPETPQMTALRGLWRLDAD